MTGLQTATCEQDTWRWCLLLFWASRRLLPILDPSSTALHRTLPHPTAPTAPLCTPPPPPRRPCTALDRSQGCRTQSTGPLPPRRRPAQTSLHASSTPSSGVPVLSPPGCPSVRLSHALAQWHPPQCLAAPPEPCEKPPSCPPPSAFVSAVAAPGRPIAYRDSYPPYLDPPQSSIAPPSCSRPFTLI